MKITGFFPANIHLPEVAIQRCSVEKVFKKYAATLRCNFIEIVLWHGCSPVNLLHIFRTPFRKNTSEWLLLTYSNSKTERLERGVKYV